MKLDTRTLQWILPSKSFTKEVKFREDDLWDMQNEEERI